MQLQNTQLAPRSVARARRPTKTSRKLPSSIMSQEKLEAMQIQANKELQTEGLLVRS